MRSGAKSRIPVEPRTTPQILRLDGAPTPGQSQCLCPCVLVCGFRSRTLSGPCVCGEGRRHLRSRGSKGTAHLCERVSALATHRNGARRRRQPRPWHLGVHVAERQEGMVLHAGRPWMRSDAAAASAHEHRHDDHQVVHDGDRHVDDDDRHNDDSHDNMDVHHHDRGARARMSGRMQLREPVRRYRGIALEFRGHSARYMGSGRRGRCSQCCARPVRAVVSLLETVRRLHGVAIASCLCGAELWIPLHRTLSTAEASDVRWMRYMHWDVERSGSPTIVAAAS